MITIKRISTAAMAGITITLRMLATMTYPSTCKKIMSMKVTWTSSTAISLEKRLSILP